MEIEANSIGETILVKRGQKSASHLDACPIENASLADGPGLHIGPAGIRLISKGKFGLNVMVAEIGCAQHLQDGFQHA